MKILVTGSSGFIGSELINFLKSLNQDIYTIGSKKKNNRNHFTLPKKEISKFFDKTLIQVKPDYIFHLAGDFNDVSIDYSLKVNCILTYELLNSLEKIKSNENIKVLIVGSAAEYGYVSRNKLPVTENTEIKPNTVYGISKSIQAHIVNQHMKSNKNIVYVRPFNVIGKGMSEKLSLGNFNKQINLIKKNKIKPRIILRNMHASRDFVDVKDAVEIFWKLINTTLSFGKFINICSGKSTKIRTILKYMIKKSDIKIDILLDKKNNTKDMSIYYGDNALLIKIIGKFKFTEWKSSVNDLML